MTGRGAGYCILRIEDEGTLSGFAGIDGKRVETTQNETTGTATKVAKEEVRQMPRGDGTGPNGAGPMTGRGAGFCAGNRAPGYMNPGPGCGPWGRGRRGAGGRGLGWGFRGGRGPIGGPWAGWDAYGQAPYATGPTPAHELGALREQAEYFGGALDDIKKRIEELEAAEKSD